MTAIQTLLDLQRAQLRHDEAYHQDILVLDTARRVKHMTLHNAKYSGRFIAAEEDGDAQLFAATLTDAFVIALATANIFAQNLSKTLPEDKTDSLGLVELGQGLANQEAPTGSFSRRDAGIAGEMAKACESLDHLEDYPFRSRLLKANAELTQILIREAAIRQIDITASYKARIMDVESRSACQLFK